MSELTKREAAAQAPMVGTVLTLPGATAAELLAEPFDVVWIDLEHGALDRLTAQEMILAAQAAGSRAMVRVPVGAYALMAVMLDAGADGIVLAGVDSTAQAQAAVERTAHPPAGSRGWGPRRLTLRRRGSGPPPKPAIWAQIESTDAVEAAREIAAVPGIDALVVGTADLSFALGAPLDMDSPTLLNAIQRVQSAARDANVEFGVAGALDQCPSAIHEAASILLHSTDARICAQAVDTAAKWLRELADRQEIGQRHD